MAAFPAPVSTTTRCPCAVNAATASGVKHTRFSSKCVSFGKLEVKKGLKMFGSQTRQLHKLLEYSNDVFIPGITGNEAEAINFLEQIGINYRNGSEIVRLCDLSEEDLKKLIDNIILKRVGSEENPADVFGDIYFVKEEEADFGIGVIADSAKEAKKIAWDSGREYLEDSLYIDVTAKWIKGANVSGLKKGICSLTLDGLKRGIYGYIENEDCPNCGAKGGTVYYDEDDGFWCTNKDCEKPS